MPQGEDRVKLPGGLTQVSVPLPNDGRIQILGAADGVKLLAGQLVHLEHSAQILDGLTAQALGEFVAFSAERLLQLVLALPQALDKLLVTRVLVQVRHQRQRPFS